jgi:DNA replication protein DnaC
MENIFQATDNKVKVVFHNHCSECNKKWDSYVEVEPQFINILHWEEEQYNTTLCDTCKGNLAKTLKEQAEKERIEEEIQKALIPPDFTKWNRELGNNELARFVENNKDKHIFLSGMYGKGKSRSLAINLVKSIIKNENKQIKYCRFTDIAMEYASICCENIGNARKYLQAVLNYDIIVIDDLGKKRITDNAGEFIYDIFDNLYCGNAKCKLWVSSNINWRKLASLFENKDCGNAVVSRIDRLISENRLVDYEVR